MPTLTPSEILGLCNEWCAASMQADGSMVIGASTEKFRLLANGVVFHDLPYESLCAALIGTSKVLLRPGLNTIIDHDHFGVWSWCGELLLGGATKIFPLEQREIKTLYQTVIHAALAPCCKPAESGEEWREQIQIQERQPHHAKQLLKESSIVLAYLGFPLLEAVLKRACANYIAFDGKVISKFSVGTARGNRRYYDPQGSYRERQCSSLRDLLFLHFERVADADLKLLLGQLRNHISALDSSRDPFDLFYSWRNQSLHGTANFQTIGGIVLNFALLVSVAELKDGFEEKRAATLEHCRWEAKSSHKSPWAFYPPY